eukprot:TRINITY_DN42871_c0_g1_i1.p1 TRINITY_DN42871_c0_g1~~TRINITY_DN42871_c0_g1_i1.p1  ORF type:complete len:361 (+),score=109.39 TRINITY_DN42871_c0_g1_i1:65-1084(+)
MASPRASGDMQLQRIAEALQCCVCLDQDKDTVLMPCRHLCACIGCSQELKSCPLCRVEVTDKLRVWTGIDGAHDAAQAGGSESPPQAPLCEPAPLPPMPHIAAELQCPLHEQCPAHPFYNRQQLEAHVNATLDAPPTPVVVPPCPPPCALPVAQAASGQPQNPPPIFVEATVAVPRRGAWGFQHQVYHFDVCIFGERYPCAVRFSSLRTLHQRLGYLAPPNFPARDFWALLTGTSNEQVQRRHGELRQWLQDLFSPRALEMRTGPHRGSYDSGAVLALPSVPAALGLGQAAEQALKQMAELRRAWYTSAAAVLAEYGVTPGKVMRLSVPPSSVPGARLE